MVNTVWDTDGEAEEFFQAMQAWLQQKYPNVPKLDETATGFSLLQDKEIHILRHEGTNVRFVIGLPESDAQKLKGF